jgi:hypothetical protein
MPGLGVALPFRPKDSFRRLSNTNAHCRVERTTHDTAHDRHDLGEIDEAPLTGLGQVAKADTLVDLNKGSSWDTIDRCSSDTPSDFYSQSLNSTLSILDSQRPAR